MTGKVVAFEQCPGTDDGPVPGHDNSYRLNQVTSPLRETGGVPVWRRDGPAGPVEHRVRVGVVAAGDAGALFVCGPVLIGGVSHAGQLPGGVGVPLRSPPVRRFHP